MRRRARSLIIAGLIGLSMAGCGARSRTLAYTPRDVTPLPQLTQFGPVAVYLFRDTRGQEERRIGTSFFYGRAIQSADPIYASEPVAVAVTRAFADGLRARGFRVIDMAKTPFAPGQSVPGARLAVSGEVTRFLDEQRYVSGGIISDWTSRAVCAVLLRAYEWVSGRLVWEKTYSQSGDEANQALARTVEAALNDPELIQQLSRIPE